MYDLGKRLKHAAVAFSMGAYSLIGSQAFADPSPSKPAPAVPHYLVNVNGNIEDRLDRMEYKWKLTVSLDKKFTNNASRVDFMGLAIRSTEKVVGKDVEIVFKDYRKESKDGQDAVAFYSGVDREFLTPSQFDAVKKDIVQTLGTAVHQSYNRYKGLEETMFQGLDKLLKKQGRIKENDSIKNHLNDVVQQGDGTNAQITWAQAMYLPQMKEEDFVPKKLIVGGLQDGILGICYLDSGWVFYNLMARVWDHIDGAPLVLIHELVHRNPELQGTPFANQFDAEAMAEIAIMSEIDPFTLLNHSYLIDVRHMSKVLFNWDAKRVADESFFRTAGGVEVDRKALAAALPDMDRVAKTVKETFEKEYLPEFAAHQGFYLALNKMYQDQNQALKGFFYLKFDPTSLGDWEKTRKRLAEMEAASDESWEQAKRNLKKDDSSRGSTDRMHEKRRLEEAVQFLKSEGVEVSHEQLRDLFQVYRSRPLSRPIEDRILDRLGGMRR